MSFITPTIRSTLPSFSIQAVAGPSRLFSSTTPNLASKRKLIAKRRKAANLALQSSRINLPESIDPVLGRVHYRQPSTRSQQTSSPSKSSNIDVSPTSKQPPKPENEWEKSKLSGLLLNYDQIAYSPPPNYSIGEKPKKYLPGISELDEQILFNVLPHVSTELKSSSINSNSNNNPSGTAAVEIEKDQNKQSEMLMRILDLRNSSKDQINFLNRQIVIDNFGQGKDTGSSSVQAALLTAKIHNLLSHITSNPKDISNKRSLRLLVQQRARHLKYFKRTNSQESYNSLLADLGLEKGAVEGELKFNF
ncbi:uncharacterized protein L201_007264 [Kwoniella dendrophila CBS 6074]|uniref:Ribosomal protein S15 n=1 Tax=Kwoniella dendrophila CBS 6074 TaxID=1295534 RepID=A0AAX4K664_9TREE